MITYVDTSSLLKLVVEEIGSDHAALIWDQAEVVMAVSLIAVESHAALAAARRASQLSPRQYTAAKKHLVDLLNQLAMVEVSDQLLIRACQLAEEEDLRAYDAIHLAAALLTRSVIFNSADFALCDAAARRGLHVANPLNRG